MEGNLFSIYMNKAKQTSTKMTWSLAGKTLSPLRATRREKEPARQNSSNFKPRESLTIKFVW